MKRLLGILLIFITTYSSLSAQENCFDYSDLTQTDIKLITHTNDTGILCSPADTDWFKVMDDTTEYDAFTDYNLKIIPQNAENVIRVGRINKSDQYNTKSISYTFEVDPAKFDNILFRYAIVGTKPEQAFYYTVFTDDIISEDLTCTKININNDDKWKTNQDGNVFYRDWDTSFVPVTNLKNQNATVIFSIEVASDDTAYFYFTLECVNLEFEIINDCKDTDSLTFKAPDGFDDYVWVQSVFSEDGIMLQKLEHFGQEVTIQAKNGTINCRVRRGTNKYYCFQSLFYKQEYLIPLKKFLPVADYKYEIDTCKSIITFTSTSYGKNILNEEIDYTKIDSVEWITQEGKIFTGKTFDLRVDENREYTLKMVSHLSESNCTDTAEIKFNIDFNLDINLDGKDTICEGESLTLSAECGLTDADYTWNTGSKDKEITAVPTSKDTVYYVTVRAGDEFCSTKYKDIKVVPTTYDTLIQDICEGETFIFDGTEYSESGFYEHKYTTDFGCDSILTLDLRIHGVYNDTIFAFLCDTGYYDENFSEDSSGFYTQKLQSQFGCDSIINLDFTRLEVFRDTLKVQIYKEQTYSDDNFTESESGTYEKVLTDINGCDSIFVLDLDVLQLKFPNAVTPNGDGINDLFEIYGLLEQTMFDEVTLKIYNRYGKQIFEKKSFKDKEDFWNPDATNTPTGTYFYRFIAKGRLKNLDFNGVIEVLR